MIAKKIKLSNAAIEVIGSNLELKYKLAAEMQCVPLTVINRAINGYQHWDTGNLLSIIEKYTGLKRNEIIKK